MLFVAHMLSYFLFQYYIYISGKTKKKYSTLINVYAIIFIIICSYINNNKVVALNVRVVVVISTYI